MFEGGNEREAYNYLIKYYGIKETPEQVNAVS